MTDGKETAMKYQFGFIGCGNMGGALARALAKSVDPKTVALCDADLSKRDALANAIGACSVTLDALVGESAYIFLGVKPQGLEGLFGVIRPMLEKKTERTVLVSMAAGTSIEVIESLAGAEIPVIRIMPNTPVAVGEGMVLYTTNAAVTAAEKKCFLDALCKAGRLDEIPEDKIDAASALSGCGPAFVYLFAEALADGAVECGLARDKANLYAAQTLLGAATLLLESGKHSGELKDAVCSPGGTTIAGVHALEASAFRAASMDAVTAAYERTLELKK